jgi:hypothetical protein
MMLSDVKRKQIKEVPDAAGAKRLADEMQASGRDSLSVDVDRSTNKSLKFLEGFRFLRYLDVGGRARDLEAIAGLPELRELCLLRASVSNFSFLAGLTELKLFDMRFGGCKAFETLAFAKHLIGVRLLRLPSLKNLDFVGSMPDLQALDVDSCKGVARLPDFSNNPRLRKLVLQTMNGLTSLEGAETAERLEYLVVYGAKALPSVQFAHAARGPAIRTIFVNRVLMTSAQYEEALAQIPDGIHQEHYFGTEVERFDFEGYERPPQSRSV